MNNSKGENMKLTLNVLALLALSTAAFSVNAASWEEIRKDNSLSVHAPEVTFGAYRFSVLDLCRENDEVRPINPFITTCEDADSSDSDIHCMSRKTVRVSRPIVFQDFECEYLSDGGCAEEDKIYFMNKISQSYKITVYKSEVSPEYETEKLFDKTFTVPACH